MLRMQKMKIQDSLDNTLLISINCLDNEQIPRALRKCFKKAEEINSECIRPEVRVIADYRSGYETLPGGMVVVRITK